MPDRYADAVRARRCELRAERELLFGGHRRELHNALALSRIAAAADTAAALAELSRELNSCLELADRATRRRIPGLLDHAMGAQVRVLHASWVLALRPLLLRIATERGLRMGPGWPRLPAPGPLRSQPPPHPVGMRRVLFAGAAEGAAVGRVLLIPLAVFPLWGLPAIGGPALAPLAVGTGIVAVVIAARARYAAAERALLRRHCDGVLATASVALDADFGRRLLELERSAGTALDAEVVRRRTEVEAELAELAPETAMATDG